MENYKVTIITPYHDIDFNMFLNTTKSVKNQTIGFNNIQWIIILHNCKQKEIKQVKDLLGKYHNVNIKKLNNKCTTPSSPRNYALQFAEAPYVSYLDADDEYTENCLEEAYKEICNTNSDIVWFRCECIQEKNLTNPFNVLTLWNQTLKRIIIRKEHWDSNKIFSGVYYFVTSRLFRKDFLVKNNLNFNEEIIIGEDTLFTTECIIKANKLCYLPQLIGYRYYMNSESLMQNTKKDKETILNIAKGYTVIFDFFEKHGIISDIQQKLCVWLSFFIINSDELTKEDRIEICNLLMPYIINFTKLQPSKLYTPEEADLLYCLPREVILKPSNPKENNYVKNTLNGFPALKKILRNNSKTDFGQKHMFNNINTVEAFKFHVPLSHYKTYQPIIRLERQVGESNILIGEKVDNYLIKENGQLIPCTNSHINEYVKTLSLNTKNKHNLLIAHHKYRKSDNNINVNINDLQSMIIEKYVNEVIVRQDSQTVFSSQFNTYFMPDKESTYNNLIIDAFNDEDIDQIIAFTTDDVVDFIKILQNSWIDLYKLTQFNNQKRQKYVKDILSKGINKYTIKKLWPKLERIIAFGAGEHFMSCREMKKYTGNIKHYNGCYYTEEAILAKAHENDNDLLELLQTDCYFELLEVSKKNNYDTINLSEAKNNVPYQIVITNNSGLYRLVSDHFIVIKKHVFNNILFNIY